MKNTPDRSKRTRGVGRPSNYKLEFAKQAEKLCELGATDLEVADFFEINITTLYRWLIQFSDLAKALKAGKDVCDDRVERSLYHRAVGYSYETVKIFQHQGKPVTVPYREHVPPDTTAATLWLKNRRKDLWRDRYEYEVGKPGEFMIRAPAVESDSDTWLKKYGPDPVN